MNPAIDYTSAILDRLTADYGYTPSLKHANSPFRPGSNSHALSVTVDPAFAGGGKWYDHVSHESGNFLALAEQLGIACEGTGDSESHAAPMTCLANYAQAHGVTEAVFRAAGWSDTTYQGKDALGFTTRTGRRYRMLAGPDKYKSQQGYERCWYGIVRAFEKIVHREPVLSDPSLSRHALVICNGEASVVTAQHYGVPAICQTGGEHILSPENLKELLAGYDNDHSGWPLDLPILVALDCDKTGRDTAHQMVSQLQQAGWASVRAVDLCGDKGFDLADFARLHGADSLANLQTLPDLPESQAVTYQARYGDLAIQQAQAQRIIELEAQNQSLVHQLQWILAMLRNKDITPGRRITAIATHAELVGQQSKLAIPEADPVPVRLSVIAEESGQSIATVSTHLKALERAGVWEREVVTLRTEDGMMQSQVRLTAQPVLAKPLDIQPEPDAPKWGGVRVPRVLCPDCGSDDIILRTEVVCRGCGTIHERKPDVPVNPPREYEQLEDPEPGSYTNLFDVLTGEHLEGAVNTGAKEACDVSRESSQADRNVAAGASGDRGQAKSSEAGDRRTAGYATSENWFEQEPYPGDHIPQYDNIPLGNPAYDVEQEHALVLCDDHQEFPFAYPPFLEVTDG